MSTPAGLYVHVPFCPVRCPYCDFYANPYRREKAEAYAAAVVRNIAAYPAGLPVDTVYFGGGTPSMLPPPLLGQMLHAARQRFSFLSGAEKWNDSVPVSKTILDCKKRKLRKGRNYHAKKRTGSNRLQ